MEKINKPSALPDCKIINALISKSNSKNDFEFNYVSHLEDIRKLISIEVSRINLLFPEYTPHDEQYHLKRLFYVADQMLGEDIIDSMNATELFLLSVSLYGHDWGMAISEEEKKHIISGDWKNSKANINLLDDEESRINEFCRLKNINLKEITINDWQEYVRLTHAFRSGKRIKKYFEPLSSGIAEFASRICEGHWLNFDIIDDHTSYPTDASVNREIVNVKALTIYVRLIDLLDLGEDRTPFILWKFVAPRNDFSKIEWAKHRSLQAVTFPRYQSTRLIQVDGSTDNQEVYMSIMDLKRYVDDQFRQCADILHRINHDYHKLNISHIDWRIAARGFEPVVIQFEFDRNRMFDILADEIYQSNPFVFIRELLQNSIDAIAVRTEMLAKKDLSFTPKIDLLIKEDDEHYIVQISDNGIGMDEYIIRNYLAVAGKSYYRSSDFQKEGLNLDPISKFGIGVLSCFMTSDYLEIETFKDPHTTQKQEHIKLSIPAKENYFKIEKNLQIFSTGTKFKVYVIKNRLPLDKETGKHIDYNVTDYLRQTAGFVKYEIKITEKNITSVINSPNKKTSICDNEFRVDYSFPIEKAILSHTKDIAKEFFEEKKIFLKEDLKLEDFDGCLTYLLPKSDDIDVANTGHSWPTREVTVINYKKKSSEENKIKWEDSWVSFSRYSGRNSINNRSYKVFMNGILIQEITPPEIRIKNKLSEENDSFSSSMVESFVNPQLIVNIPKPEGLKIDLARTNIESREAWDRRIWVAFFEFLKKNQVKEILQKDPSDRFLALGKLVTFYKLSVRNILEDLLPSGSLPMPMINSLGKLIIKDFKCSDNEVVSLAPKEFEDEFYSFLEASYISGSNYEGMLELWRGQESLFMFNGSGDFDRAPASISNMRSMMKFFLDKNYYLSHIEFITSTLGKNYPLVSEVWVVKRSENFIDETQSIDLYIPNFTEKFSISRLNFFIKNSFYKFPTFVQFPPPYQSKTFYGFKYINIDSEFAHSLIKVCLTFIKSRKANNHSNEVIGKIGDLIENLPFLKYYYSSSEEMDILQLNEKLGKLFEESIKGELIKHEDNKMRDISLDDFIEGSIKIIKKPNKFSHRFSLDKYLKTKEAWGNQIV